MKSKLVIIGYLNKSIFSLLNNKKDIKILAMNENIENKLNKKGLKCASFLKEKFKFEENFNFEINDFFKILKDDIKLKRVLHYKGYDLTNSYYGDGTRYLDYILKLLWVFDNIIRRGKYTQIITFHKEIEYIKAIEEVCKKYRIKLTKKSPLFYIDTAFYFMHYIKPRGVAFLKYIRNFIEEHGKNFKKTNKKRIMFLCGPRANEDLIFVMQELKKKNKYQFITIKHESYMKFKKAKKILHDNDLQYRSFISYFTPNLKKMCKHKEKELMYVWENIQKDYLFHNKFQMNNINYWFFIKNHLNDLFKNRAGESIKNILITERIMRLEKPVLYVSESPFIEFQRDVLWAASQHIPCFAYQGALLGNSRWIYVPLNSFFMKMAVWGSEFIPTYTTNKKQFKKFVPCGITKFDKILKNVKMLPLRKSNEKIILFTAQFNSKGLVHEKREFVRTMSCVIKAVKNLKNTRLIIKPHPSERNIFIYRKIVKKINAKNVKIVPKNTNTYDLIYSCDLLITINSTTGIDAIYLNKPVISVVLTNPDQTPIYALDGAALLVKKENDLLPTIKKIFFDNMTLLNLKQKRNEFIRNYCYKNDGKAVQRVVKVIESMINK